MERIRIPARTLRILLAAAFLAFPGQALLSQRASALDYGYVNDADYRWDSDVIGIDINNDLRVWCTTYPGGGLDGVPVPEGAFNSGCIAAHRTRGHVMGSFGDGAKVADDFNILQGDLLANAGYDGSTLQGGASLVLTVGDGPFEYTYTVFDRGFSSDIPIVSKAWTWDIASFERLIMIGPVPVTVRLDLDAVLNLSGNIYLVIGKSELGVAADVTLGASLVFGGEAVLGGTAGLSAILAFFGLDAPSEIDEIIDLFSPSVTVEGGVGAEASVSAAVLLHVEATNQRFDGHVDLTFTLSGRLYLTGTIGFSVGYPCLDPSEWFWCTWSPSLAGEWTFLEFPSASLASYRLLSF